MIDSVPAQAFRVGEVHSTIRCEGHAVIARRIFAGDEAVEDVARYPLRIAPLGIAEAAAAGELEPRDIARGHGLAALGSDLAARGERDAAGRTQAAAVAAARRIVHALEIAQQADRRAIGAAQFDHLAKAAAELAGAARAFAEFATAEDDRRHALRRLDRDG